MLGNYDTERIRFMETQKVDDELETGMELLRKLYAIASQDKRTDIPLSELHVGLKCGGSDGFSGITANPLLGVFFRLSGSTGRNNCPDGSPGDVRRRDDPDEPERIEGCL